MQILTTVLNDVSSEDFTPVFPIVVPDVDIQGNGTLNPRKTSWTRYDNKSSKRISPPLKVWHRLSMKKRSNTTATCA